MHDKIGENLPLGTAGIIARAMAGGILKILIREAS